MSCNNNCGVSRSDIPLLGKHLAVAQTLCSIIASQLYAVSLSNCFVIAMSTGLEGHYKQNRAGITGS